MSDLAANPNPDDNLISRRRIHELMFGRFSSISSLARHLQMHGSELSRKIYGHRRWYLNDVKAIADALDTSMAYLTGETDDSRPVRRKALAPRQTDPVELVAGSKPPELLDLDSNQEPIG